MDFTPEVTFQLMAEMLFSLAEANGGKFMVPMVRSDPDRVHLEVDANTNTVTVHIIPETIN